MCYVVCQFVDQWVCVVLCCVVLLLLIFLYVIGPTHEPSLLNHISAVVEECEDTASLLLADGACDDEGSRRSAGKWKKDVLMEDSLTH